MGRERSLPIATVGWGAVVAGIALAIAGVAQMITFDPDPLSYLDPSLHRFGWGMLSPESRLSGPAATVIGLIAVIGGRGLLKRTQCGRRIIYTLAAVCVATTAVFVLQVAWEMRETPEPDRSLAFALIACCAMLLAAPALFAVLVLQFVPLHAPGNGSVVTAEDGGAKGVIATDAEPTVTKLPASDARDLRLLTIANYTVAGTQVAYSGFISLLGISMVTGFARQGDKLTAAIGAVIVGTGVLLLWGAAILHALVARSVRHRRAHRLSFIAAVLTAMNPTCFPVGGVVGALTAIVLKRRSIRVAFGVE